MPVEAKRSHPRDGSRRNERNEEGIRTVGMFSFEIEFHMSEYIDLLGSPYKNHARYESSSSPAKNPAVSVVDGKRNDGCNRTKNEEHKILIASILRKDISALSRLEYGFVPRTRRPTFSFARRKNLLRERGKLV